MTEAEWLAATAIGPSTLVFLPSQPSDRKLRLFAVACCLRIERLFGEDERFRKGLEVACRVADGSSSSAARRAARREIQSAINSLRHRRAGEAVYQSLNKIAGLGASYSAGDAIRSVEQEAVVHARTESRDFMADAKAARSAEASAQLGLLRDIVGNPFRPVFLDPEWLTTTVTSLARTMYDTRDFAPMPLLADALQDAGCDQEDILNHCRSAGPLSGVVGWST